MAKFPLWKLQQKIKGNPRRNEIQVVIADPVPQADEFFDDLLALHGINYRKGLIGSLKIQYENIHTKSLLLSTYND